jgi:hypothetical protein
MKWDAEETDRIACIFDALTKHEGLPFATTRLSSWQNDLGYDLVGHEDPMVE